MSHLRSRIGPLLIALLLALFLTVHLYLINQTFLPDGEGEIHSTLEGYGDIPLHLTQVSKFAFGLSYSLDEPIFYQSRLVYPFLINLLSGLLLKWSGLWTLSVLLPVFLAATAILIFTFLLYRRLLGSSLLALFSLFLFYLGGGMGLANTFDAVYPAQNIAYGAPLTFLLIHQRAFLLGLALVAFALWLIERALLAAKRRPQLGLSLAAAVCYGLLPLAHSHSFVALSIILAVWLGRAVITKHYNHAKILALVVLGGGLIALPQIFFLLGGKSAFSAGASFLALRAGWMIEPGIGAAVFPTGANLSVFFLSYLNFLWLNFGLLLPTFLLALVVFSYHYSRQRLKTCDEERVGGGEEQQRQQALFVWGLSALAIFLIVMVIRFQPWDYDNNKLLIYWQWLAAPVIVYFFSQLFSRWRKITLFLGALFLLVSLWFGVADLFHRLTTPTATWPLMFSADALRLADYVRNHLSPGALVITSTDHRNPLNTLAGRPAFVGYTGWLWTRGLDYRPRENLLKDFYRQPAREHNELFRQFPASYVVLDDFARHTWQADQIGFARHHQEVFRAGPYILYFIPAAKR